MKPQDILYLIALIVLIFLGKPKWLVCAGLLCLLAAIPLFAFWIFFSAQRLVYYAAGLILAGIIVTLLQKDK